MPSSSGPAAAGIAAAPLRSIDVLDPRALPEPGTSLAVPPPLGSLAGKVVGFVDNTKPNFNHLVDALAEELVRRHGVKAVVKRTKRVQSVPAPGATMDELAARCDLVITGSGD